MSLKVDLSRRVAWREQDGRRYLWFDCSDCNKEEGYALQEHFHELVAPQPLDSVRVLADFENGYHDTDLTRRWKDLHAEHASRVHKIACLGVVGSMKIVFAAYRFFVRLKGVDVDAKMQLFDDKETALEWLLS